MASALIDVNQVGQAGMDAMGRGDSALARAQFQLIIDAGQADAQVWLAMALACQAQGDAVAFERAVDQVLAQDPRNLRAALMKADSLAARGDKRGAMSFYALVSGLVPEDLAGLPPQVVGEVTRARSTLEALNVGVFDDLRAGLVARGYQPDGSNPRFDEALALLSGEKQRYVSTPRSFFFPGLANIQFFPRQMFPWIEALEAATDDITAELMALMAGENVFAPYIEAETNRPTNTADPMLNNTNWSACYLWRGGQVVPEIAARCPKTMAALEHLPLEQVAGRAPFVLFSKLAPGARIEPHTGFHNTRLVCHLPLIVPPGCMFRVGNETREWVKGKVWTFDDTIEHEAHNGSDQTRVVLIFNVWRPELTLEERELVASLMEGIDRL